MSTEAFNKFAWVDDGDSVKVYVEVGAVFSDDVVVQLHSTWLRLVVFALFDSKHLTKRKLYRPIDKLLSSYKIRKEKVIIKLVKIDPDTKWPSLTLDGASWPDDVRDSDDEAYPDKPEAPPKEAESEEEAAAAAAEGPAAAPPPKAAEATPAAAAAVVTPAKKISIGDGARMTPPGTPSAYNVNVDDACLTALDALKKDAGVWWVLLASEPKKNNVSLVESGGGGLQGMLEKMHDDKVYFGAFKVIADDGDGKTRREKHMAFSFTGPDVGGMVRGRVSVQKPKVFEVLQSYVHAQMDAFDKDDFGLADVAFILLRSGASHKPKSFDFGDGRTFDVESIKEEKH